MTEMLPKILLKVVRSDSEIIIWLIYNGSVYISEICIYYTVYYILLKLSKLPLHSYIFKINCYKNCTVNRAQFHQRSTYSFYARRS